MHLAFQYQTRHIKERGSYSFETYPEDFDSRFYHFDVLGIWGPRDEPGSALLGRFAVNRFTGDVWDVYAKCRHVSFPALRKLQAKLRRQYGLPDHEPDSIPKHGKPPVLC